MSIYDDLQVAFGGEEGKTFSTREIRERLGALGRRPSSVIPSDYCYNRRNKGISHTRHLFEYLAPGQYRFLGAGHRYSGLVFTRARGTRRDVLAGVWDEGSYSPQG